MMNEVAFQLSHLTDAHWLLEQMMDELTNEHLHWEPPGTANTIAATYAHVITSEDAFVQRSLQGRAPLYEGEWRDRTGLSLPVPERGSDWFHWSRQLRLDLAAARLYAAAVYAASEAYVRRLTLEELSRPPDAVLPGNQTLSWLLHNLLVLHAASHAGEIAVLKGLQGLRGYQL